MVNNDPRRVNQTCRWRCLCPYHPSISQLIHQQHHSSDSFRTAWGSFIGCEASRCRLMTDGRGLRVCVYIRLVRTYMYCASCEWLISPRYQYQLDALSAQSL